MDWITGSVSHDWDCIPSNEEETDTELSMCGKSLKSLCLTQAMMHSVSFPMTGLDVNVKGQVFHLEHHLE